jgi:hypothetical protein
MQPVVLSQVNTVSLLQRTILLIATETPLSLNQRPSRSCGPVGDVTTRLITAVRSVLQIDSDVQLMSDVLCLERLTMSDTTWLLISPSDQSLPFRCWMSNVECPSFICPQTVIRLVCRYCMSADYLEWIALEHGTFAAPWTKVFKFSEMKFVVGVE